MLEAVDTIDELKFEDPFSSLTPLDFEDIVLKVLYTKPDIASKVFPKLSRTSFMNDANGELVELTKKFFKEHSRYPGPQEFYDLYIKDANIKEKFRNLGLVKVHKYDDAYIKAKVQEFVRMRLTFSRLMEASARLRRIAASSGVEETSRIACAIFTLVSIGLLLFTGSSWSIADRTFIIAVK
jgi:hypothetical protein